MYTTEQTRPFRKTFICKRLRLLEELNRHGFYPIATIPEPESGGRYRNWIFEGSQELEEVVANYIANARKHAQAKAMQE